jgi:hypothetical protein
MPFTKHALSLPLPEFSQLTLTLLPDALSTRTPPEFGAGADCFLACSRRPSPHAEGLGLAPGLTFSRLIRCGSLFVTARLFHSLSFQPRLTAALLSSCSVANSPIRRVGLSPTFRSASLAQTACPVVWEAGGAIPLPPTRFSGTRVSARLSLLATDFAFFRDGTWWIS